MYANPAAKSRVRYAARSFECCADRGGPKQPSIPYTSLAINAPLIMPMCPLTIVPIVTIGVMCPPEILAAQYTATTTIYMDNANRAMPNRTQQVRCELNQQQDGKI